MTIPDEYIIVTGGLGYIGSHTVIRLLESNYKVIIIDNLANSSVETLMRIRSITNYKDDDLMFYEIDVLDMDKLTGLFETIKGLNVSSLIHFAGLKSVSESVANPIKYYETNFTGSLNLLKLIPMISSLQIFIFSSSATIYGDVKLNNFEIPIVETTPFLKPTSPYGESKLMVEKLLNQYISTNDLKVGILRYFNPIGAHHSGLIGEDSKGNPTNLLPILGEIAIKNIKNDSNDVIKVYGNDYDTVDGTPIRDYIHIEDLSNGHLSCLNYLKKVNDKRFYREWNLGTGKGLTVLEIINYFNKNLNLNLKFEFSNRRPGDVEILLANPKRANKELNWRCKKSINDSCVDLWRWLRNLNNI